VHACPNGRSWAAASADEGASAAAAHSPTNAVLTLDISRSSTLAGNRTLAVAAVGYTL
jgi:hypothetical protein